VRANWVTSKSTATWGARIGFWVALGSGLGGAARVAAAAAVSATFGPDFPFGILFVNVAGSLVIGLVAGMTVPGARLAVSPAVRDFLAIGFCGGFTTFSFFSLQTLQLLEEGRMGAAFLYSILTLALSLLAVGAGYAGGVRVNRQV
jgi:fluoride exporter